MDSLCGALAGQGGGGGQLIAPHFQAPSSQSHVSPPQPSIVV